MSSISRLLQTSPIIQPWYMRQCSTCKTQELWIYFGFCFSSPFSWSGLTYLVTLAGSQFKVLHDYKGNWWQPCWWSRGECLWSSLDWNVDLWVLSLHGGKQKIRLEYLLGTFCIGKLIIILFDPVFTLSPLVQAYIWGAALSIRAIKNHGCRLLSDTIPT